ncbi:MAG TPA: alpha/beta hydrolase [Methylophilaceae bacterium]
MNKLLKSLLFFAATSMLMVESGAAGAAQTLETAPTKYIEANGVKFSYRTLGPTSGTPLILLQHFTGTMDSWDPAVVNGLAKDRPVVVFNNRGVGNTSGTPSDNVAEMTSDAYAFITALGYKKVDLLGFSLGGFIAQELAVAHPDLVNKVILAGTSNQGGGEHLLQVLGIAFSKTDIADPRESLFFSPSAESQQAARDFVKRAAVRTQDRDPSSGKAIADAQAKAIITWANTNDTGDRLLKAIQQPVLIVQGSNDTMLISKNSLTMFNTIKNAELVMYPDSNHGSIFQYHDSFVNTADHFLSH